MNLGIVLFHTTSSALRAEKLMKQAGLNVKLIPTPRELSSDCGMALRFELCDRETVERVLVESAVDGEIHLLPSTYC